MRGGAVSLVTAASAVKQKGNCLVSATHPLIYNNILFHICKYAFVKQNNDLPSERSFLIIIYKYNYNDC